MADITDFKTERDKIIKRIEEDKANRLREETISKHSSVLDDVQAVSSIYATRAEAEEQDAQLKFMNANYVFVHSYGGKPAIKSLVFNEFYKKEIVEFIAPESIHTIYLNEIAKETENNKKGAIPLGKWWLGHAHRKDYKAITFEPNKAPGEYFKPNPMNPDKPYTYFNMWEGFGVKPKKGIWKKFLKHIYETFCNKNPEKFNYVVKWFAWAIQNPGTRAEVALIFKGKKGTGKGMILQSFREIFGRHGLVLSNREHLTGKHNEHLSTCSFLFADEAYNPGDKEVEGILKNIITEPSLTTEPKFRGVRIGNNCLHITMASNADWIIPATEDERRYFINEVESKYAKNSMSNALRKEYFDSVWKEIENGGLEAILFDLSQMKLGDWHPRDNVPDSEEMRRQIEMSLPKLKIAFMNMLEDGVFPGSPKNGEYRITNKNLTEYIQNLDVTNKTITGKQVSRLCQDLGVQIGKTNGHRYYSFPELGALRDTWNRNFNKRDWRTNEKWEVSNQY